MAYPKGRPRSPEAVEKIRRTMRSPEWREAKSRAMKQELASNPEAQRRLLAAQARARTPEARVKMRASHLGKKLGAAQRAKISIRSKELWKRPGHRERILPILHAHRHKATATLLKHMRAYGMAEWMARARRVALEKRERTSLERAVSSFLDEQSIDHQTNVEIDRCQVDILVPPKIVIECDGSYWHNLPGRRRHDQRRDGWLRSQGYTVIRLKEEEIKARDMRKLHPVVELEDYRRGRGDRAIAEDALFGGRAQAKARAFEACLTIASN